MLQHSRDAGDRCERTELPLRRLLNAVLSNVYGTGENALAALFIGKAILCTLPMFVFGFFGFLKWRKHYGPGNSIFGYYLRYMNGKRATDDPWPTSLLKMAVFLVWFMIFTTLVM